MTICYGPTGLTSGDRDHGVWYIAVDTITVLPICVTPSCLHTAKYDNNINTVDYRVIELIIIYV